MEINIKKTGLFSKIVYFKLTNILMLFFLCAFIILSMWFQHKLDQSQKRRYLSYVAADELRQSSDDLTRMVRTYVMTKDPRYEKMYWDILAIRNGEKARPLRYENIYWDFVALSNEKPRPDGQIIPLLKIMEDLAFTQEEFAKLADAEMQSNDLVRKEMIAMHAMKGEFLDAEGEFTLRGVPDYDYAQALLYDESYHSDKVDIMNPIDEFFVLVNARTEAQVNRDTIYTYICIFLVYATITLLLLLSRVELNERKKTEKAIRESEEQYRSIVQTAIDGFWLLDIRGNLLKVNEAYCHMSGYSEQELLTMRVSDLEAEESKAETAEHIKKVISQGSDRFETRHRQKDGNIIDVEISAQFQQFEGERIVVFMRDITERKQLEEEKQKFHKLESIGILAGGIAHDFNNLLAGILNNIYLVKMHMDRENKEYKHLESAEKAISRASNLTTQLLTFAKGGSPIKKTASIIEIIKESAEFVLRGSNVKCEYIVADDLWPVEVDEGQMNQVIHNLILNANQSMPEGGTIRITTENSKLGPDTGLPLKEGRYVKVEVQDQGTGISEEHLKNIFDPYFTTKEAGRGLGLAITYSIIKQHDGLLTADSELGVGTIFIIYLPASEKRVKEKESVECTAIAGGGKILIMDDEEIIRESVGEFLTMKGYEVEYAEDGDETIELYKKAFDASQPFDAVILDLTIRGGMGGKATVKKLLEIDPDVKAIVSSGYSNDPVMANHKKYGFSDVFCKASNSPDDLCRILNNVLKIHQ